MERPIQSGEQARRRPTWRTHWCVPWRGSFRHVCARGKPGVGTTAGAARTSARATSRGFTFVELMVVITIIVILISMAIPIYQKSIIRAKESVLANNLFTMRTVIDNYTYDKEKAPQTLQDLVTEGYLKDVPVDPMTGDNQSWKIVMEDASQALNQSEPGIFDVHSGSDKKGLDGVAYSDW